MTSATNTPSAPITAILLAAGQSRRMGAANKLLLEIDGRPMVRHAARTLLASRVDQVIAVLGHDHVEVAEALSGLPLRTVVNRDHANGQMTSVAVGMAALDADPAAILVALADQPALEPADIDFLIDAFLAQTERKILIPTHGGQRGNPIVLPGTHREALLAGGVNFGCRNLIQRNPEAVTRVEVPSAGYVQDIDTPASYEAWVAAPALRRQAGD